MLVEKDGIVFALIEKRFDSFDGLSKAVKWYTDRCKGRPLVIVFPELALGENPVNRLKTKKWLGRIGPLLAGHSDAHVFLSLLENAPLKKTVTNTGYLVSPPGSARGAQKPFWQAQPKLFLSKLDEYFFKHKKYPAKGGINPKFESEREHWRQRTIRNALGVTPEPSKRPNLDSLTFSFPRVRVNNQLVELRVCGDALLKTQNRSGMMVVPARTLFTPEEYRQEMVRLGPKDGFVLVNDLDSQKRPQIAIKSGRRLRIKWRRKIAQFHPKM